MRVWIVGPGAVGTVVGGLLAQAGHEITFIGRRPPQAGAGAARIRLVLPDRWLSFQAQRCVAAAGGAAGGSRAAGRPKAAGEADLVVVTLRRDHLVELRRSPLRGAIPGIDVQSPAGGAGGGPPVLYVNGAGPEPMPAAGVGIPAGGVGIPALRALTLWTSVRLQADAAELVGPRPVFLGDRDPRLRSVYGALRSGGVEIVETDSVEPYARSLFVLQLLDLPVAMCHSTCDHFLSYAEGREIAAAVLDEGLRTLQRCGEELRKLPVMDPGELLTRLRRGGREAPAARFAPDRGYNGVLQAILRGEKTEVPELNGRLVRRAAEAGVEARWNWRLVQKLSRVVQVGFYRDPADLHRALS